jgi:hypothetical protein
MPTRRDFLIGAAAAGLPSIINSGIAGPASPAATTRYGSIRIRFANYINGRWRRRFPPPAVAMYLTRGRYAPVQRRAQLGKTPADGRGVEFLDLFPAICLSLRSRPTPNASRIAAVEMRSTPR